MVTPADLLASMLARSDVFGEVRRRMSETLIQSVLMTYVLSGPVFEASEFNTEWRAMPESILWIDDVWFFLKEHGLDTPTQSVSMRSGDSNLQKEWLQFLSHPDLRPILSTNVPKWVTEGWKFVREVSAKASASASFNVYLHSVPRGVNVDVFGIRDMLRGLWMSDYLFVRLTTVDNGRGRVWADPTGRRLVREPFQREIVRFIDAVNRKEVDLPLTGEHNADGFRIQSTQGVQVLFLCSRKEDYTAAVEVLERELGV